LTKPDTFQHDREASVATLRWCSDHPGMPFGLPRDERSASLESQPVGDCMEAVSQPGWMTIHCLVMHSSMISFIWHVSMCVK